MKALTLTQPYATLVVEGWKKIETRNWQTHYRGPLAIHAAATFNGVGGRHAFDEICLGLPDYVRAVVTHHYAVAGEWDLPRGQVLAVTWVLDCIPAEDAKPDDEERSVGDYRRGRWAWLLREPVRLPKPLPIQGHQGLWNLDDALIPENVQRAITHAV